MLLADLVSVEGLLPHRQPSSLRALLLWKRVMEGD